MLVAASQLFACAQYGFDDDPSATGDTSSELEGTEVSSDAATEGSPRDPGGTVSGATSGPMTAPRDDTANDPSGTGTTASTSESAGATSVATEGVPPGPSGPAFTPAQVFGDDDAELDLVGTWGLGWSTVGRWDQTLVISPDGRFEWRETSADCFLDEVATGALWIEGTEVVFHAEAWERDAPFETQEALGEALNVPFRLRLTYAAWGDELSLYGPQRLSTLAAFRGAAFVTEAAPTSAGDVAATWTGRAVVEAVPAQATDGVARVRVEEVATLVLTGDGTPTGNGRWTRSVTYDGDLAHRRVETEDGTWQHETPSDASGFVVWSDRERLAYGVSSVGTRVLGSWADGASYRRDIVSDCD